MIELSFFRDQRHLSIVDVTMFVIVCVSLQAGVRRAGLHYPDQDHLLESIADHKVKQCRLPTSLVKSQGGREGWLMERIGDQKGGFCFEVGG